VFPITDPRMTRFVISLQEGVGLVWQAFNEMFGGEIFVKKMPSVKICDIAKAINPNAKIEIIGIRPGEKLHEQLIGVEDAEFTFDYGDYFKILPQIYGWSEDSSRIGNGKLVSELFNYSSDRNKKWLTVPQIEELIATPMCR
jgi:UDP-N-acetylglucosamine 4,6-dehydratase